MVWYKPAGQITEADLWSLVSASGGEDERLEFKSTMYGKAADDVREMIRDIASLANTNGGLILIGVMEDDDGVAVALPGVTGSDHVERITSSAQANISPRISGLDAAAIRLADGKFVIAIDVPRSSGQPHMTTFRSENRFWKRYSRQKGMMSRDEIEASFTERFESASRVERFLADRRSREYIETANERWLILQAAPLFMKEELFDVNDSAVRELLFGPPTHDQAFGFRCEAGAPRPSLRGLRAEHRMEGKLTDFSELWREGYLEYGTLEFGSPTTNPEERASVPSTSVYLLVYSFIHLYKDLLTCVGISPPVVVSMSILKASGLNLAVSDRVPQRRRMAGDFQEWRSDRIELPVLHVSDLRQEADEVVQRLNDRLWNAFGYDRCLAVGQDGSLLTS